MKNIIRCTAAILVCVFALAGLCSCRLEHFDRDEIVQWVQEHINSSVIVSNNYMERENEGGYTDRVWEAFLEALPDIRFEVVSHKYWGMESVSHSIETTYYSVYGEHCFLQYTSENDTVFETYEEQYEFGRYGINAQFADREGISSVAEQAEDIEEYMSNLGFGGCISYRISYDDPLDAVDDTDVCGVYSGDLSGVVPEMEHEFALYVADYRLALDQFTTEELVEAVAEQSRGFMLTRADGSVVAYPDISLSRFGYGMSFGALYEVLEREGFEPMGTPDAFTVTGGNGSVYEFSYWFNDYPYEVDWAKDGTANGYYYIKDGEKIPMSYYFYNHFRSGLLEEISGMTFSDL